MHGGIFLKIFLVIAGLSLLMDRYVFNGLKTFTADWPSIRWRNAVNWGYLVISVGVTATLLLGVCSFSTARGMTPFHVWVLSIFLAFFFTNSKLKQTMAFYPSPAGATESLLSLEAWTDLLAATPTLADLQPDVEGLLVHKGESGFECFAIPIDACYELVGLVRMHWKGFDGGEEAWTAIHEFFAGLRERSEIMAPGMEPADG